MSKEMIVSVNGREKKIAIIDNGKVTEFYIERGEENTGVVGNVYKGRVMRVLPGMQSAFVDIGLERDAFLYVSDFFDEEEEIERVVMEKNKKGSPEDVKREANDQIDRMRAEREKQMDAAQDITEPLEDTPERDVEPESDREELFEKTELQASERQADEPDGEPVREQKRSRRGRRGGSKEFALVEEATPQFEVEYDNSGFERISDGEGGDDSSVKAIVVETVSVGKFEMEGTTEAEVGSLLSSVTDNGGGFERIADEDDEPVAPAKSKRGRLKAKPIEAVEAETSDEPETGEEVSEEKPPAKRKAPAKRGAAAKGKFSKPKAKKAVKEEGGLEDAEASHKEPDGNAEMAVRRGGRGRRRGGKKEDGGEEGIEGQEITDSQDEGQEAAEIVEAAVETAPIVEERDTEPQSDQSDDQQPNDDRSRGRDNNNRDRDSRSKRGGRNRNDRPSGDRPAGDRPSGDRPSSDGRRDRNDRNDRGGRPPMPTISDLLKEGQEILVQIAKEPIAKKGARITSHIALPGRYLVYMPTIEHLGVSRKIESASERSRLRTLIQRIRQDDEITSGGFIVRTAGIGVAEEDLRNDAKYLARMWADSKKGSEKKRSPAMVHQDLDLVQRLLRDQLADDFTAIRVDSEEEYLRTVEFMNLIQPRLVNRVKLYTRDEPILEYYGVQEEIDKALKPRVWLKSGGYLVINQTEALVAIDVNTGKFVGKGNARLEDTITRTNMEAAEEIARQIRLRDLGGIIVLDLIDMEDRRNRNKVAQALQEALASDKSPNKVLSFNDFGLIIMTRKRVKQSLERTMCAPCDYCEGAGWVKSPTTMCYEILAESRRLSRSVDDVHHTTLRVHPDVATAFRSTEREVLEEIEEHLGHIDIASDKSIHQAQFDFAFV